jgi:outer membrane biosynthesis protein TonB
VGQILGQFVLIAVVSVLWGALLFGFLSFTSEPEAIAQTEEMSTPAPSEAIAEATSTPTQPPATPTHTATPVPTKSIDTPTPLAQTDEKNTPVLKATPQPTSTSTPQPAPTDTPPPPTAEPTAETADTVGVSFKENVLPILERRCVKCHGGINDGELRVEEGLKLTSHADILAGSFNGPVIEPGNAENSYLIEQIVEGEMPKKEPRLLPKEIQIITEWVKAGAPDN